MSSPEQRVTWERKARWLAELGLAQGESAPVDVIEEVASAALSLLDEVGRLEVRVAWLSRAVAEGWPTVATDLTFVRVNDGVVSTTLAQWDGGGSPLVGDRVVVGDGGPLLRAVVTAVEGDVLRLQVDLGDDHSSHVGRLHACVPGAETLLESVAETILGDDDPGLLGAELDAWNAATVRAASVVSSFAQSARPTRRLDADLDNEDGPGPG